MSTVIKKLKTISPKELPARVAKSAYWRVRNTYAHTLTVLSRRPQVDYLRWITENECVATKLVNGNILISVVIPVFNVKAKYLNACIQSVIDQTYQNWELCLYDDASTEPGTRSCLERWEQIRDERIKIVYGKINLHMSGATNEALKSATGHYVAFMDNDDTLAPDALAEVVAAIKSKSTIKYIYSDEDKISENGKERFAPFFKPDWSPDLLLSMNYTSHLSVFDRRLVQKVGGFREGFEGAQDYDLELRIVERLKPEDICHIPKVLYHWRAVFGSTATGQGAKRYTTSASEKALLEYMLRNRISGSVEEGLAPGSYRIKREIVDNPRVAIIIPFRDGLDMLKAVVNSIFEKTVYQNYELVLVDNQSQDAKTLQYLKSLGKNKRVRILQYDKPYNFSAINNYAVKQVKADYVLLLNNDMLVITEEWLSAMLEQAQRSEIGAVGARLLYPDGRIQHAGVIMGMGVAGHSHKYFQDTDYGYFSQLSVIRNYLAVTAACLLISRDKYLEVGGLDEKNLSIAYNDVDFCLRLVAAGYRNIYTPYAKLYHLESATRGLESPERMKKENPVRYKRVMAELSYMKKKWGKYILNDPYYNQNLTRKTEDFALRLDEDEI